jgi:hypothetical protein
VPIIFEVVDPRGYKVVCDDDRWKWHVVDRHRNMEGEEEAVQLTIEKPSLPLFQDKDYPNRVVYYRLTNRKTPRYMKVVVEFNEQSGELVTALFVDKPKPGEKMI